MMPDESSIGPYPLPILNLVGEKVALGPLHDELIPLMTTWDNDFATSAISGDDLKPSAPSAVAAAWERLISGSRDGWYGFAIYERATLRPIGHANLRDVTTVHRTAEFGILIGERECRGKGYGTEVTQLILDFAFNGLNLHNVWLDTLSLNPSAIASYQRAGFREIGRRREAYRIGNQTYDVILMDCLATDFQRPDLPEWGMAGVLGR
jgi:diamine N-acetyltransferase